MPHAHSSILTEILSSNNLPPTGYNFRRARKALALAPHVVAVETPFSVVHQVPSQFRADVVHTITGDLSNGCRCSCEDWQRYGKPCKHVIAARLASNPTTTPNRPARGLAASTGYDALAPSGWHDWCEDRGKGGY